MGYELTIFQPIVQYLKQWVDHSNLQRSLLFKGWNISDGYIRFWQNIFGLLFRCKTLLTRYLHKSLLCINICKIWYRILVEWEGMKKSLITKIAINKYIMLWNETGMNHTMIMNISGRAKVWYHPLNWPLTPPSVTWHSGDSWQWRVSWRARLWNNWMWQLIHHCWNIRSSE